MSVSICLVGAGLVGKEVLSQLSLPLLASKCRVDLIANSKYQVSTPVSSQAVPALKLLESLPKSSTAPDAATSHQNLPSGASVSNWSLQDTVQNICSRATKGDVPVVFVDCTSDNDVADAYPTILSSGAHLVTPNKKGFSNAQTLTDAVKQAQAKSNALIYQEATVGAGLPIISTLKDLLMTGDDIIKIEGVLSGTMSYIFNNFSQPSPDFKAPKFSEVVKVAKDNGYTEPHPADDLNGSDVARKLAILTRIIDSKALPTLTDGYASVPTESLVPKELDGIASGDEFMQKLPQFDDHFAKIQSDAHAEGKVLRFVALIDVKAGVVKAGLEKYPFNHPFASALSGSANIVSFLTERYPIPMLVQGSGAGAAVTAMGVVGDIIKVHERVAKA